MIDRQKRWMLTYLFRRDWPFVDLAKFFNDPRVMPEVLLATDEEEGRTTAKVSDVVDPLKTS